MNKLESFKDIKYHEDILYILGVIKEQKNRKPSEIIDKMGAAATNIAFYVNHLQSTRENYEYIVRDLHIDNLKLKDEIRNLKEELKGYTENVDFDISPEQKSKGQKPI